jgi:hypothetical protein
VTVAVLLGIAAGLFAAWNVLGDNSDFRAWWLASRLLMSGIDPYLVPLSSAQWPWSEPLFYPGPAVLLSVPLGWLPLPVAVAVFIGSTSCALAWVLSASGWWRLWFFASPAFIMAVEIGQWSPAICLAATVPALGWMAAAKPNLGAAALLWRPSPLAIGLAIAATLLSVFLMPQWPGEWMANLAKLEKHPAPLFTPAGCWLLVALVRWRHADARLLLAMAAVPQLLFFADQLPLYLLARSRREASFQVTAGLVAYVIWFALLRDADLYVLEAAPYVLVGVYGPALMLVLSRRNEGDIPPWLERVAARFPAVLRGSPSIAGSL